VTTLVGFREDHFGRKARLTPMEQQVGNFLEGEGGIRERLTCGCRMVIDRWGSSELSHGRQLRLNK